MNYIQLFFERLDIFKQIFNFQIFPYTSTSTSNTEMHQQILFISDNYKTHIAHFIVLRNTKQLIVLAL